MNAVSLDTEIGLDSETGGVSWVEQTNGSEGG